MHKKFASCYELERQAEAIEDKKDRGHKEQTFMVTSSSPSATTTLTGGGSLSASSNLSFTALREFFTCGTAMQSTLHAPLFKLSSSTRRIW